MDKASSAKLLRSLASVFGVALLVALVTGAAAIFEHGNDFWVVAIAGYLVTVPLAVAAWHGDFFGKDDGPRTPLEWLLFFAISAVLSGIFVAIDIAVKHPGISLAFTIGALAMMFIALPSAARAWMLEWLSAQDGKEGGDAKAPDEA